MKYTDYYISLDVCGSVSCVVLNAKRGDCGRTVHIKLRQENRPYEIAPDTLAVLSARKPDGNILYNSCVIREQEILYTLTEQTTAAAGIVECEIKLLGPEGEQLTAASFYLAVEQVVFEGEDIPGSASEYGLLQDFLNRTKQASEQAEAALEDAKTVIADTEAAVEHARKTLQDADAAMEKADTAQKKVTAAALLAEEVEKDVTAAAQLADTASETADAANTAAGEANRKLDTIQQAISGFYSMILDKKEGDLVLMTDSARASLEGLKIFGRSVQDGEPSVEAPVEPVNAGDSGSVEIRVLGKNLMSPDISNKILNGISCIENPDGSVTVSGTATATANIIFENLMELAPGDYLVSGIPGGEYGVYYLTGYDGEDKTAPRFSVYGEDKVITLTSGKIFQMRLVVAANATVENVTYHPMIRRAEVSDADYEVYDLQTASVTLPQGCVLPGIPGTQVRDYIDLAAGQYVKQVGIIESYSGENVGDVYLSTTGALTSGAKVMYPLDEPECLPLEETEMEVCAGLHTNYPYTAILCKAGTDMEVTYVADIKRYVDEKVARLSQAIVGNA